MLRLTSFALTLAIACLTIAGPLAAAAPVASDYYSQPPLMVGSTKPAILMIVSKDMDMFAPAYVAPADVDGDLDMDIGFNPAVEYTGIFDPYSCYTFVSSLTDSSPSSSVVEGAKDYTKTGDDPTKRGHFVRVGPSLPDMPDAAGQYPDANRLAKEIRDGYDDASNGRPGFKAPKAKTGICPGKDRTSGTEHTDRPGKNMKNLSLASKARIWSGNWLNWMTSSRIDVVRQVLYGGKRVLDLPNSTYLTVEWIPENASVWAYDDFTKYFWLDYNEGSPYYDTANYTPISNDRWAGHYRRLHSYGRVQNRLWLIDSIWFMRQKEDVTNHEGFRSFNAYYVPKYRNQYTPLDYVLNSFADNYKTDDVEVVVEACRQLTKKEVVDFYAHVDTKKYDPAFTRPTKEAQIKDEDLLEKGDYCQRYGNYFKPTGLLQKYSELDQALFGLMTGAFNNLNRWDAGWLRHNVTSIKHQINSDGTYKGDETNNIFKMFDSVIQFTNPRLDPWLEKRTGIDTVYKNRRMGWADPLQSNFGNPIGEMLYAGLLYFAKNSNSTYSYWPTGLSQKELVDLPKLGSSSYPAWQSPLFTHGGDCLKPVILLLSSTTTSHDGDMLPGSPHGQVSGLGATPQLSLNFVEEHVFNNQAGLQKSFNMSQILGTITDLEGFAGKKFYIANTNLGAPGAIVENGTSDQLVADGDTNLCVPRVLNNLADVRGLCPSSPQTYGTYSVAAAAYYGNTHDFDGSSNKVHTFAVALPSIFPKINLTSNGRTISISPTAMSVTHPCGTNDGNSQFCKEGTEPYGIQYLGPFTTSVIQWRADDDGHVYSGAVFAGFNGRLEGEGEDYQLDAPVRYYFDLIRECYPGECQGGATPSALTESFRYTDSHSKKEGHPSRDDERDITYAFINQDKYKGVYYTASDMSTSSASGTRCNNSNRDKISGCGSSKERLAMRKIAMDFKDGRYAAAPFKRHREWVYKNWDHAGRPNYVLSGERPKNYHIAAYMPKRWSQLPGHFVRPVAELTTYYDPDPALMQSYARAIYPWTCGTSTNAPYSGTGCTARTNLVKVLPGASAYRDQTSNTDVDYVPNETASLFIDRPFEEIGYEEVMDVYGYIGEPGHIYKKVGKPEEIPDAVGVAIFMYSLYEEIDNSDRAYPINLGYYMHGGLSYPSSKEDNPSRTLTDAEGTYLEIQNEHNYMGGSPYQISYHGATMVSTAGREKGLMTIAHPLNTPPTCYQAGQAAITEPQNFLASESNPALFKDGVTGQAQMPGFKTDTDATPHKIVTPLCGSARLPLTSTRLFRFPQGPSLDPPEYLPDPLWLAAKYGGFSDENHNGKPEPNEYDILPPGGDGIPDNYFYANNLTELKDKLSEAFERIMSSMNVGTATSASVNSVLGGGITVRTYYQSIHTPTSKPETPEIKWLGGTYALFVDLWGNMREDTNGNGQLDLDCGFEGDVNSTRESANPKGDWVIEFVDCNRLGSTAELLACAQARDNSDIKTVARVSPDKNGRGIIEKDSARSRFISLEEIRTVWNLSRNLSDLTNSAALVPANYGALNNNQRRVYFHQDGVTPNLPAKLSSANLFIPSAATALYPHLLQSGASDAVKLISYILGVDQSGFRSRTTISSWYNLNKGQSITCRLGDVINSQPIIAGAPFSNYDYLYGDTSYALYKAAHFNRRNLALVGANDGMLHAVNMGYPISLKDGYNGYRDTVSGAMGREMWAFIPQALLPHLQWLTQMDYAHSYYMDMTPTVVEVKDAQGDWRTLVIASLRFGGRAIETKAKPATYSYSEVFALDITNPETEPTLLWRFSHPQMGLVVARPTVVRNTANGDNWYAIVGSGPTYDQYDANSGQTQPLPEKGRLAYEGHSNQSAKVFVFNALTGPGLANSQVTTLETNLPKSFITNFQVLNAFQSSVRGSGDDVTWSNSLAYFSVNQSAPDTELLCLANSAQTSAFLNSSNPADMCQNFPSKYSNFGYLDKGSVWRLNMTNSAGTPIPPQGWQNNFKIFFNSDRPVSAAVNTTFDVNGNLWVLFGSGRFWSAEDSRLCEGQGDTKECRVNHVNYIYGIKEPANEDGIFSFPNAPISESSLLDVSNVVVYPDATILAEKSDKSYASFMAGGQIINRYSELTEIIASPSYNGYRRALKTNSENYVDSAEVDSPGNAIYDGTDWWKGLNFEMVIHQMAVAPFGKFGSVIAFSSFLPQSVACGSMGISFAMLLDTFTGLPKPDFSDLAFQQINNFQDNHAPKNDSGLEAVSDHVYSVSGLSAATIFVMTGTNESKRGQFETVNSDGTVTVIKLPEDKLPQGGVLSWREVLDFSTIGVE
ncbi:MAG: hypothetical protein LBF38_04525 [Deltaproteobacteria bacterium]|jgi:hypothetical protein|nr:hypothetical protein [Deltaproteobacteria bacterium]